MTKRTMAIIAVLASCFAFGNGTSAPEVDWSAMPTKETFQSDEPIFVSYHLMNRSKSSIWVPKSINPYISVLFHLSDPGGHPMRWNGARFTFKYDSSDLRLLPSGEAISGTFQVPAACPNQREIEKGGFCFRGKGQYTGTATFRLGLNAFYNREKITGQIAEGPYTSTKFSFMVK